MKDGFIPLDDYEHQQIAAEHGVNAVQVRPFIINAQTLTEYDFPPRRNILSPWLPERGIAMIVAARGIGKTWVALNVGLAAATGSSFLGWMAPTKKRILYIDGEMPAIALQERFRKILSSTQQAVAPEDFHLIAADLQERGIPSLATREGQAFVNDACEAADLIIVDNIATVCGTGGENDSDAWRPVQDWALRQRSAGRSVLFVHHASKNGGQRGTSAREDVLDSVINLRHPFDYDPQQGARFEVVYTKARGFYGVDAEPFEARFVGDEWITGPLQAGSDEDSLRAMQLAGLSVREIAERSGLSKSNVARKLNRSIVDGNA
jgi:putative DNA primase/helicase